MHGSGIRHRRHDDRRRPKIVVIEKDDQGKPDVGKSLLAAAYGDDKVDIAVGTTGSRRRAGDAAGGRGVQEDPAGRARGRRLDHRRQVEQATSSAPAATRSQDAIANAVALDKPGVSDRHAGAGQCLRPRRREGLQGGAATKAKIVHEEYLPADHDRLHRAGAQRLIDALQGQARAQDHLASSGPAPAIRCPSSPTSILKRYGIEIATGGNILPAMAAYKQFPGMEGATYYYFGIPKNPVNEWLVAKSLQASSTSPPDFFTAGGMSAASRWSRR